GDPMNAKCDQMSSKCAGVCIGIGNNDFMCSQPCSFAGEDPIDSSLDCGGIDAGLCAYSVMGTGPGDNAFCTGAWTTHDGCNQDNVMFCWDFLGTGMMGHGFCANIATPCTKEGAACTGAMDWMGSVCTKTKDGSLKCLDPTYPPPTGGGGAGGAGGAGGSGG